MEWISINTYNLFDSSGLSKDDIMKRLIDFTKELKADAEIIVIGSSAIILNAERSLATSDIDVLNTISVLSAARYDIQIVNRGILFLCPDYESRLVKLGTYNEVKLYSLGLLDIALVKLGRGLDKDISDIKDIINSGKVSLKEIISKYPEFRSGYGGSTTIIDNNYWAATGQRYNSKDKRMF